MKKLSLAVMLCLVWVGWAWAHGDLSKFPASVQIIHYKMKVWMNPDDLETRNKLAMAFYLSNKLEEAEKELRYVLRKDPQDFDALDGLGIVLTKMARYQEALEYLNKAVRINEHDVMVHVHRSVVYQKMEMPERAKSELEKVQSLISDSIQLQDIEKEQRLVNGN
jgi:Flp pilus assembly protein TadD